MSAFPDDDDPELPGGVSLPVPGVGDTPASLSGPDGWEGREGGLSGGEQVTPLAIPHRRLPSLPSPLPGHPGKGDSEVHGGTDAPARSAATIPPRALRPTPPAIVSLPSAEEAFLTRIEERRKRAMYSVCAASLAWLGLAAGVLWRKGARIDKTVIIGVGLCAGLSALQCVLAWRRARAERLVLTQERETQRDRVQSAIHELRRWSR